MHFFHPIQQSALHIYHSALPLSPKSLFRSMIIWGKTPVADFYGYPDAWGVVLQTIAGSSKGFTCTATFDHKIAIAYDDGTVAIHDSVTGVLRLSLSPVDPVRAVRGSQDGSTLFCSHQTPSVTWWDIQTGGLIHTLILKWNVEDITVSLKGRYLACRLSDGTIRIWEAATKMECAAILNVLLDTNICWLKPEHQLAFTTGASVHIWDVVSGRRLRHFSLKDPMATIFGAIYSERLDRLIVVTISTAGNAVSVIDPLQGLPPASHGIQGRVVCFTFSQTTDQLVYGAETDGLKLFDVSTQHSTHLPYPDRATFVSSLPNGTVAASFANSGVQVLSLEDGLATSQQSTISPLTVKTLDKDRIVVILPTSPQFRLPRPTQFLSIVPTSFVPPLTTAWQSILLQRRGQSTYNCGGSGRPRRSCGRARNPRS